MSALTKTAEMLGLPPGVPFKPDDDELVEFFLLPRARGHQAVIPGVIIDDDTAGTAVPWKLLARHGRAGEDEAYFFVRTAGGAAEAEGKGRGNRQCDGGAATWVAQKSYTHGLRVGGGEEQIKWKRSKLNLHMSKGGKKSGSVGWVMHEYSVEQPGPSFKICHVAFTGHGQKRKRVPDGEDDDEPEPASQRPRADAAAANSGSSSTSSDHASTTTTMDQDIGDDLYGYHELQQAAAGSVVELLLQTAAPTAYQNTDPAMVAAPLPMVQEYAGVEAHQYVADQQQQEFCGSASTTTMPVHQYPGTADASSGGQEHAQFVPTNAPEWWCQEDCAGYLEEQVTMPLPMFQEDDDEAFFRSLNVDTTTII